MFIKPQEATNDESLPLISTDCVSKKYSRNLRSSLWYGIKDIAREILPNSRNNLRLRESEFWALKEVSFNLHRGESLAIVGTNGSGKSTLLKLLFGLIRPDGGEIKIRGSVGAMIELHSGLDPALTGRENIYLKAALYGFARHQVKLILDEIIEFAEISEFIDSPIRFYSSGMLARLGFAVATHLKPDVLLVDEVLAVGDFNFQRKCLNHLAKFVSDGGSLILVSHNPHQIQNACRRGLLLDKGRVIYTGTATETLSCYFEQNLKKPTIPTNINEIQPSEKHLLIIDKVSLEPEGDIQITTGCKARITVNYRAFRDIKDTSWHFSLWTADNSICITGSKPIPAFFRKGCGKVQCTIPDLNLTAGNYLLKVAAGLNLDELNGYPLSLFGWENPPLGFSVINPASKINNDQISQKQLTILEVE